MVLTAIESIGDNQANIERLRGQLRTPVGVTPFVGAGISIPFGYPGWTQFLLSEAEKSDIREEVHQLIERGQYEEAAERCIQVRGTGDFQNIIENTFGAHHLPKTLHGAVTALPLLPPGPVVTTNFDRVLERAYEQAGRPFERELWGARARQIVRALYENRRLLLKIHGDVEDPEDRVLTHDEYMRFYENEENRRVLRFLLENRPLLFVGCSLHQDRTMQILDEISKDFEQSIWHYAIIESPEKDSERRARARFLADHGIHPIWFRHGEFGELEQILRLLVKPAPAQRSSTQILIPDKDELNEGELTGNIGRDHIPAWIWIPVLSLILSVAGLLYWRPLISVPDKDQKWDEDFLRDSTGEWITRDQWTEPARLWRVIRGVGTISESDGAAVIVGKTMAVPKLLWPSSNRSSNSAFWDFDFEIIFHIRPGARAAWMLRADPRTNSGYLFEFQRERDALSLKGFRTGRGKRESLQQGQPLVLIECCKDDDYYDVVGRIRDHDFSFDVKVVNTDLSDRRLILTDWNHLADFHIPANDNASIRYGSFGLMQIDENASPVVERVCLVCGDSDCVGRSSDCLGRRRGQ